MNLGTSTVSESLVTVLKYLKETSRQRYLLAPRVIVSYASRMSQKKCTCRVGALPRYKGPSAYGSF